MRPSGRLDPATEPAVAGLGGAASPRRWRVWMVAAAVALALVVTALVSFRLGSPDPPRAIPTATPSPTPTGPPSTAEVYAALAPSVVTVEALTTGTDGVGATGTGVIASADGVILTALHVVRASGSIRVRFADGTASAATLIAADPAMDIAALAAATLPTVVVPAVLGSSGRLAVGDSVVAIGNQLGYTSSATYGVVSGLDRAATGNDGTRLNGLIQFDAAVNPGSSGGPLVNVRGETVGIVVALANPTEARTFIGIGFAVPIGAAVAAGRGGGGGPQQ
jgi:putative serine protease PepD